MKFTVACHAGLFVEAPGASLMVDPWIVGSSYWRSWWNYPKAAPFASRLRELDYVYLTHMHSDHFHGPSLRKLPRSATLLIPEAHFPRFRRDAELFRFARIVELPHGKPFALAEGVTITSYQYSLFTDTAVAISDGDTTLLNLNDCKPSGRPLQQIVRDHPNVDFMFRSHSSAQAYPYCVTTEDTDALVHRSQEDYMAEFAEAARTLRPRYAIPFASAHCFLHRDTYRFNDSIVSPVDVRRHFERQGPDTSRCVVMVAGDSWSSDDGFQIQEKDWFDDRDALIAEYAREKAAILEKQYALEESVELAFRPFQKYFQAQIDNLPRISRLVFHPRVVFGISDRPDVHWVVDYAKRSVYEADKIPDDYAVRIVMPAIVLKDCIYKRMFSTFCASKRLAAEVRRGHMRDFLVFFHLLDMSEYDYFPLRNLLRPRFIAVWLRRWREIMQHVRRLAILVTHRGDAPLSKLIPKVSGESKSS